MNANKLVKILAISFSLCALSFMGLLFWGLSKLPSASEIKSSLSPTNSKIAAHENGSRVEDTKQSAAADEGTTPESLSRTKDQFKEVVARVLVEDFVDARKPLVSVCRDLGMASESALLRDPESASANYFFSSLAQDRKDPIVESAAPFLRYIFRAPGMQSVVDAVMTAESQKDQGLLHKAEFYYELFKAGEYLQSHTADMDRVLQKSYNLHYLSRAVAMKPELAADSATLSFCEQMETSVNADAVYNAEEAAEEMLKFLNESGIDAKTLGYDPKYRSQVKVNLSNSQLGISEAWVVQLFARDIERAQEAPSSQQ